MLPVEAAERAVKVDEFRLVLGRVDGGDGDVATAGDLGHVAAFHVALEGDVDAVLDVGVGGVDLFPGVGLELEKVDGVVVVDGDRRPGLLRWIS